MHYLLSLATDNVFYRGIVLLNSWKNSKADDFFIYDLDCSEEKKVLMKKWGAQSKPIPYNDFSEKAMFYKMVLIRDLLKETKCDYVTYVDLDTQIIKNWDHLWKKDFNLYMTIRPKARSAILNVNAGVMYLKNCEKTIQFFDWCIEIMTKLSELKSEESEDDIMQFCLIEARNNKINPHKLSWWCDQLFLSAICDNIRKNSNPDNSEGIFDAYGYQVGLLHCPMYNDVSEFTPDQVVDKKYLKDKYVLHYKGKRKKRVYPFIADMLRNKMDTETQKVVDKITGDWIIGKGGPRKVWLGLRRGVTECINEYMNKHPGSDAELVTDQTHKRWSAKLEKKYTDNIIKESNKKIEDTDV